MVRAQWGTGSASGWDPTGGGVSSGKTRTAVGKILATGAGSVAIRLERLQLPLNRVRVNAWGIPLTAQVKREPRETSCSQDGRIRWILQVSVV